MSANKRVPADGYWAQAKDMITSSPSPCAHTRRWEGETYNRAIWTHNHTLSERGVAIQTNQWRHNKKSEEPMIKRNAAIRRLS